MIQPVRLEIAGLVLAVHPASETMEEGLRVRFAEFLAAPETPADFTVTIRWTENPSGGSGDPRFEFDPQGITLRAADYEGRLEPGTASGWLETQRPVWEWDVEYFLRVAVGVLAFRRGGAMLHTAGILHRGRAFLFMGHSGAGKTTVSRLSCNDHILNDDLVVVLPRDGGWWAYATPFWKPTQVRPTRQAARLSAIFHLVQAKTVRLEPVGGAFSLAEVTANFPIISANPYQTLDMLDWCGVLTYQVPSFRLHFLPDDSFWQVIDGAFPPVEG